MVGFSLKKLLSTFFVVTWIGKIWGLSSQPLKLLDRRCAMLKFIGAASLVALPTLGLATEESSAIDYHQRDRGGNKNALVRDDYWYFYGKTPPRVLNIEQLPADDPAYNTWGLCTTSKTTGNSCTYVPLRQRNEGYSKYYFSVSSGVKDFASLEKVVRSLRNVDSNAAAWNDAARIIEPATPKVPPSPAVDALLKAVLLGTSLLVSPNFSGPQREVLVARFYVNEAAFATDELRSALEARDVERAISAWEFGRDSWNSYLSIVNRAITVKVGEPFQLIGS